MNNTFFHRIEVRMKFTYPAICHYEENGYWCEFPDLSGCFSQGDSEREIVENAQEALEGYLVTILEEGKKVSKPSNITDFKTDGKDFLTYISCDIEGIGKSVRKNVTLPFWLDRLAEKASINFSQTLQESLLQKLELV